MLEQAYDYREECNVLYTLLEALPDNAWRRPTQHKGWTIDDVLGTLHLFDVAAQITLDSEERLRAFLSEIQAGWAAKGSLMEYTRGWLDGCQGPALRERWYTSAREVADYYARQDPGRRVAWWGPDMSVRSCISLRQMEVWALGQAVFDLLGVEREEGDRLRNIAVMGINTFGWSFTNRGLAVPPTRPHVRLTAPSEAIWEWGQDDEENRIEGSAVDFCRVVTLTRNIADTELQVRGDIAHQWMAIAQCFASSSERPPAPGTRYRQTR